MTSEQGQELRQRLRDRIDTATESAMRRYPYTSASLADAVLAVIAPELSERDRLRAEVAAARQFAGEMRDFCSPHGVAASYADQLIAAMDRTKEGSR